MPTICQYCERAGEVVEVHDGNKCLGEMHVSGDGINGAADIYGEHYVRLCQKAAGGERVTLTSEKVTIIDCAPRL